MEREKILKVPKTYIDLSLSLFAIFTFPITHTSSFAKALFTFLLEQLKIPREEEDNLFENCFVCWGARNTLTKCIMGNVEMVNTHALLSWKNNFMFSPMFLL